MSDGRHPLTDALFADLLTPFDLDTGIADAVTFSGSGSLVGYFAYTDFLAATLAVAGAAIAELLAAAGEARPTIHVDRALASRWARSAYEPITPEDGPKPFRLGGEYRTADDRWIRLTDANLRLQERMLAVLGTPPDLAEITAEIGRHKADDLEAALLAGGGAAAAGRSMAEWALHPAGQAVASQPLVDVTPLGAGASSWRPTPGRPLAGIRVLDTTRAIAGPMATRLLAGFGAEVLRVDIPGYAEWEDRSPTDTTLGKRCAYLDLRTPMGKERFIELLATADVFVHGLRPGVFEELGIGEEVRERARPDLVEVTHNAYGWSGPWAGRRGFDSTVTMSSGLVDESMRRAGVDTPHHPGITQLIIVDHCLAHFDAASVVNGLTRRLRTGQGSRSRLSLACGVRLLGKTDPPDESTGIGTPSDGPFEDVITTAVRGPIRRLASPIELAGNPFFWEHPGEPYGSSAPVWVTERAR